MNTMRKTATPSASIGLVLRRLKCARLRRGRRSVASLPAPSVTTPGDFFVRRRQLR
jgi:hypothetical protein